MPALLTDSDPFCALPLSLNGEQRAWTILDSEDYEWAKEYDWKLVCQGRYAGRMLSRNGKKQMILLHRTILGLEPGDGKLTDHRNRDKLDNRRSNLRLATPSQNAQNRPAIGGLSKYRGVSYQKAWGRWVAAAELNYRYVFIGGFDTEEEAGEAAAQWRAEHMPYATN